MKLPAVIIVAGPTASGKSAYAEQLAVDRGGEIVNADAVQMYTRLAIGTAKPDWRASSIPHHLFDICGTPIDFDVVQYRQRIMTLVDEITARGKVPILVGGSLFYIKSLFYPPIDRHVAPSSRELPAGSNEELWQRLQGVDPDRAAQIHPNDRYRVARALHIYDTTGTKPSELMPQYQPVLQAEVLYLAPALETLYQRINARTLVMINEQGWVDEARSCYHDEAWREFVLTKGFIGYPELFAWIERGEPVDELPAVIAMIQQKTRHYAKRQRTFWRSFCEQIARDAGLEVVVKTFP